MNCQEETVHSLLCGLGRGERGERRGGSGGRGGGRTDLDCCMCVFVFYGIMVPQFERN